MSFGGGPDNEYGLCAHTAKLMVTDIIVGRKALLLPVYRCPSIPTTDCALDFYSDDEIKMYNEFGLI